MVFSKKNTLIFSLVLLTFLSASSIYAQTRGSGFFEPVSSSTITIGKQWAVFIAIDNYREWGPLLYAVKDATEIKDILLRNYRIDPECVRELYNQQATVAGIRGLFVQLQREVGPDDSVFIFHAGHGINDDATRATAWIPYDAGENRLAQSNWLPHYQVRDLLNQLNARHVLLVSDSCYSGDLLDPSRGIDDEYPPDYNKSSRLIMSSGASEQVKDESEFAARFKNALLRAEGPYITPDLILARIKEIQTTSQLATIPILAPIPNSSKNELGGSFFFLRNNTTGVPMPTAGTLPGIRPTPTPLPSPPPSRNNSGIGYGFMNLALGLGSYLQGDVPGGAITTVGLASAIGLFVYDINLDADNAMAGTLATIGVGVGAATIIFGFVKPILYSRNHQLTSIMDNVNIKLVSGGQNMKNILFGYNLRF